MRVLSLFSLFILMSSCTSSGFWKLDSIAAGNEVFDSARLIYEDPSPSFPFRLEFLKVASGIHLTLNCKQFAISPSQVDPPAVRVRFVIEDAPPFEEMALLGAGRMRLRLSLETAYLVTKGLQEGKKIDILVDDMAGTIYPERFEKIYEQFTGSAAFFKNLFKGS